MITHPYTRGMIAGPTHVQSAGRESLNPGGKLPETYQQTRCATTAAFYGVNMQSNLPEGRTRKKTTSPGYSPRMLVHQTLLQHDQVLLPTRFKQRRNLNGRVPH